MDRILKTLLLIVALAPGPAALAQGYPAKPVRIVVPLAAGGGVDNVARLPGWGGEAVGSSPEVFAARYRGDIAKLGKVVSEARIPLVD